MPVLKKNAWTLVKEWSLVTLGILIYVTGWGLFLIPNNLVGGGVSGLSSIIQYATGGHIQMGYTYLVLNVVLILTAMVIIGMDFGAKTIYAILLASLGFRFLPGLIPSEIIYTLALQNGKLMSTLCGGIMIGIGIGMSISNGGSTGGTDIIALIYTKYRNVSPGKVILYLDFVIILSTLLVPSFVPDLDPETGKPLLGTDGTPLSHLMPFADKVTTAVYGLILVTVNGHVIDMYLSGSRQSVQLFILSKHYSEIADSITRDLHRGVTVLDGKGWYTQQPTEVLMVITRKTDLNLLLRYVKAKDPDAFLSVSSVNGVYGRGFESIKDNKSFPAGRKTASRCDLSCCFSLRSSWLECTFWAAGTDSGNGTGGICPLTRGAAPNHRQTGLMWSTSFCTTGVAGIWRSGSRSWWRLSP